MGNASVACASRGERGVSLIETLVAVSMLGISMVAIIAGFRIDRTVTCSTPVIRTTVPFFDRSEVTNGVIAEQLSWTVLL